jgi:hypothetical protein
MIDHDLIGLTMHEAQRLSAEPVGPNPFKSKRAIETLRDLLDPKQESKNLTDQRAEQIAALDIETAILYTGRPQHFLPT